MGDGQGTPSIALLSGTDDKLNAAALLTAVWPTLILATTAAAMGMETIVFFTFWGLFPLVRNDVHLTGDNWMQKAMSLLPRGGTEHQRLSPMKLAGAATALAEAQDAITLFI
jgi:peroxiredoxin family protein